MTEYLPNTKYQWIGCIASAVSYSLLEYFFGKTDKTKAGSLLEFVLLGIVMVAALVASFVLKKEKKNGYTSTGTDDKAL